MVKPVVKVYLLPHDWSEEKLQKFYEALVATMRSMRDLGVWKEEDLITLFPSDLMVKGLGTEIHVEVDIPEDKVAMSDYLANAIGHTVLKFFPDAYIQCKVYTFEPARGFWASKQ